MTDWRDLKPDNLVRVTFEMPVRRVGFNIVLADGDAVWAANSEGADAAKWELLAKPLRVGPAKFKMSGVRCDVLALHGKLAWVKYVHTGDVATSLTEILVNIDEEPKS